MPVLTGFQVEGTEVGTAFVHAIDQWLFLIMQRRLSSVPVMTVACLALMVSVLVRSTAASIVIMMASIIAGLILANMASAWESAKYLFMVNLDLSIYLTGQLPPIEGMSLLFSMTILAIWALGSLFVSFTVFTKQDILN